MSSATQRTVTPRLHVVKDLSLAASGLVVSQGAAELLLPTRKLEVPAIIVPRVRKWRRPRPETGNPIQLEDEQLYPSWYKPVWRIRHKKGQGRKFVQSFADLELVLAQSKLRQTASWAVWRAIYINQECFHPFGFAKPLSLMTLAAGTGFAVSSVQLAIEELLWRNMIEVFPSEGWQKPKAYATSEPYEWRAPK